MKRKIGLVFLLLLLFRTAVLAESATVGEKVTLYGSPAQGEARGTLLAGTRVEVIASEGEYAEIRAGAGAASMTGFVRASSIGDAVQNETYGANVVSPYGTPAVVLRSSASDSYEAVAVLPAGTAVTVLGSHRGYLFVRTGTGQYGFLAANEIQ